MARFSRIMAWLNAHKLRVLLFLVGAGVLVIAIGLGAYEFIGATESTAFCGEVCHTPMYPEYTVYQASAHSTVECTSCHVGAGAQYLVASKLRGIPQLTGVLFNNYERPIKSPVTTLRPARETCEQCHTPERFSADLVRSRTTYKTDEANTAQPNTLVLKVGGGKTGVATGIHWHILAKVYYLPMDNERLQIGWVREEKEGSVKEYINPAVAGEITPERIEKEKRLMDCVDCHNRATHVFRSPNDLIDRALEKKSIDASIPYIKREAMRALGSPSPSLEEAYTKVDAIENFYRTSYPSLYTTERQKIVRAIDELKEVAKLSTFPEMRVDWNTHADQSGHNKPPDELIKDLDVTFTGWRNNKSPGCFRCHGVLVPSFSSNATAAAPLVKKPLDAGCNLCHYSPGDQPGSPLPKSVPHPSRGLEDCVRCHGPSGPKPFPDDHPWSTNEICTACHEPSKVTNVPMPEPITALAKDIPHGTKGLENCLICHDKGGPEPFAKDHPWSPNDTCSTCHKPSQSPLPNPTPQAAPATAKAVPHPSRGLEECLLCHGKSAPQPLKADHPWATRETCSACHRTATALLPLPQPAAPAAKTPQVPHPTRGLDDCLLCHGKNGPKAIASTHPWSSSKTCSACHSLASTLISTPPPTSSPPGIPHGTEGMEDCRLCHGSSVPYPDNHTTIPTSFCTLCHR